MTSFHFHAAPNDRHADADPDARLERIRHKLLDGIEEALDELVQSDDQPAALRAAIEDAVWARIAPLLCGQATCRRAQICRGRPCRVTAAAHRRPD